MPVRKGKDKEGPFYRYGKQKKYHFKPGSKISEGMAKAKAKLQGKAIKHSQYGKR